LDIGGLNKKPENQHQANDSEQKKGDYFKYFSQREEFVVKLTNPHKRMAYAKGIKR
jgi:hypothetical protein